ncbi:Haloacid dehalogenase-like hydrolase [Pleurostoma richardsiae]|uniref:Haloacid dehalogenase-like hydrolase n=1 Tax=Pleurostoma richardsiae TaxID=41990 RepID=A0AA38VWM9_9PEZI|nr:Haloacid dehalogenase-like hydrolase [Pleurostoma richardsiae]
MATIRPRQFAPLKPGVAVDPALPKLKGVVFDVDGTLCQPQNYMFGEMRAALGITKSVDILDHVYSLPTPEAQHAAQESIRAIERRAMASQVAQPGLVDLMDYLDRRGVRKGICTRNFEQPVNHLLGKFLGDHVFEPIVTRDFRPPKPDPAGILHIARSWGLVRGPAAVRNEAEAVKSPGEELVDHEELAAEARESGHPGEEADASALIMVGDSIDDMTAGHRAGAATVLLVNDVNRHLAEHEHTDLVISRLDELIDVLEKGFLGRHK